MRSLPPSNNSLGSTQLIHNGFAEDEVGRKLCPHLMQRQRVRSPHQEEGCYARIRLTAQLNSLRSSEATRTREASAMHSSQAWGWRGTVPKASPRKGT